MSQRTGLTFAFRTYTTYKYPARILLGLTSKCSALQTPVHGRNFLFYWDSRWRLKTQRFTWWCRLDMSEGGIWAVASQVPGRLGLLGKTFSPPNSSIFLQGAEMLFA